MHAAPSGGRVRPLPAPDRPGNRSGPRPHLILDNYATHKTEAVKRWLARHPRFHVHFTPTSASWINAVEGLFATLTKRRLKRGVFHSVLDLNHAIRDYLDAHNADPKPFRWTACADTIISKHQRGKRMLESIH